MEIIPFESFGELRFGTSRSLVRTQLSAPCESFLKDEDDEVLTDACDSLGLHMYYDRNDLLEVVEAFAPCSPMFQGVSLIGKRLSKVVKEIRQHTSNVDRDEVGADFPELGFGLIAAPDGLVEGVSVYRRGYYDELDEE